MIYLVTNAPALIKSTKYTCISIKEALSMLERLKIVGVDTETEGFDVYTKKLLSLQLGCFDFQAVIDCTTVNVLLFKDYLESERLFLFWNAKFDLKFLYYYGIIPRYVWDGYLAEKLMWLGYPSGMHGMGLKDAGINYLGVELDKTVRGQIINKGLTEDVIVYAGTDVKYLEPIMEKQKEKLKEQGLLDAIRVENAFVRCLAYIEFCGAKIDPEKWKKKLENDSNLCEDLICQLNKWVEDNMGGKYTTVNRQGDLFDGFDTRPRCHINWKSAQQVIPLFEDLGLNLSVIDPKTKRPKKSTDIKVIGPQASKSPLISIFMEYKKAAILVDTFGEKFLDLINPKTKRIHANFNQLGTDTGRLSSTNPNLQNLPSDALTRSCFIAEPGNKWISADYSGQESFLMASIANDKAMLDELVNGSGDLHSLTAKMVFLEIPRDTPLKAIKTEYHHLRKEAKGYEFCFNYGGMDNTLVRNYGISEERAKEIYTNYMEGFSGLRDYQKFRRKDVMEKGYILLSPITGHKAYIYDFAELKRLWKKQCEKGFWEYYREMKRDAPDCETVQNVRKLAKRRAESEKQSINYPIQAAGALCFKYASIFLFKYLQEHDLLFKVKYCIPVHDEINLEAPAEIAEEIGKVLVQCMEKAGAVFCKRAKLSADLTIGDYWIHE